MPVAQDTTIYSGDEMIYTVPANTIAEVTGSTDFLTLSTGDTLAIAGNDDTVAGLPDSQITVSGTGAFVSSSGPVTVDPGGNVIVSGAAPAVTVVENGSAVAMAVASGTQSLQVTAYTPASANGDLYDEGIAYSSSDGTGAFLADTKDYSYNISTVDRPASGAFGNYDTFSLYSGAQGTGTLYQSINNIVSQSGSTYTDSSIVHTYQAGYAASSGIASSDVYWSQAYGQGTTLKGLFAYTDGSSAELDPFNGAFGCYRTVSFYTGANQTGTLAAQSFDIVNGTSQTSFTGTGAFGCYKTVLRTSGADATGTANASILDFANNSSEILTLSAGGTSATDVFTTGPDGTGSVTSSATVAPGMVVSKFDAFTVDPSAPHTVSMGDFLATGSGAVAAVTPAAAAATTAAAAASPLETPTPTALAAAHVETTPQHGVVALVRS